MKTIVRMLVQIISWPKVQEEERPAERWGGLNHDDIIARLRRLGN